MKTQMIGLAGVAAGLALAMTTTNCGQPEQGCPVPHLSTFVKYTLVDQDKASQPCGALDKTGESWSFSKYNQPGTTVNTIAVRPERVGNLASDERLDEADKPDWTGGYDFSPNAQGFCVAHDLTPVEVDVPEMPTELEDGGVGTPLPPEKFAMTVTNLQLVGTPQVPGTQFKGELDYTAGGCTAHYTFLGIAPQIPCCKLDPETDECVEDGSGNPIPDDTRCETNPNFSGSGIPPGCNDIPANFGECLNPDFVMQCDTDTLICMPKGEIPTLKK